MGKGVIIMISHEIKLGEEARENSKGVGDNERLVVASVEWRY